MSRGRFGDGPPRMRRKLPLRLTGDFDSLAGEAWWMDTAEVVFWCVEKLSPGTLAHLHFELGLMDQGASLHVQVTEQLDRPEIKLRSGHLHTARFLEPDPESIGRVRERLTAGSPGSNDDTARSGVTDPSAVNTVLHLDEHLIDYSGGSASRTDIELIAGDSSAGEPGDTAPEDPSASLDQPRLRPRGRRLISRALTRSRGQTTRTETGGRRPVHVPVPAPAPSTDRPLTATIAQGTPESLLLRFRDDATFRAWVTVEDEEVRVTIAPLAHHSLGARFLVVLQFPDATYVQFHGRLARQKDDRTEILSDRLSFGTLHPIRKCIEGA